MIYINARAIIERKNKNSTEIIIQTRNKVDDFGSFELPGGQINKYESLLDAVKREVLEETGLEVISIDGQSTMVDTKNRNGIFVMECIKPYAVYQTIKGPVDSIGVYFKCKCEGHIKEIGDDTINVRWINVEELKKMVDRSPELFSGIDLAGIIFYLNDIR